MRITSDDVLNDIRTTGRTRVQPRIPRLGVGMGTCGMGNGAKAVFEALRGELDRQRADCMLVPVGCFGFCAEEPLVNFYLPGEPLLILSKVQPGDAAEIVSAIKERRRPAVRILCRIEHWDHLTAQLTYWHERIHGPVEPHNGADSTRTPHPYADIPLWHDVPFFRGQKKIVLRNCGLINPDDIEEYIAVGGYRALSQTLAKPRREDVVEEIKKSKLRGRGGAGFPTGNKWQLLLQADSDEKYLICNADEGDPGAYMNRNEIESDPHMLLEGMLIGACAMRATHGVVYLRAEYPLAVKRLEVAIRQARDHGLLGKNILGSDLSFDIQLVEGAGAFVCGEETALITSLEGKAGRPRPRPPYPAERGLWGKPTNINNVETWCNIPVIIARGARWFTETGTLNSSGTKVFSLVGKIKNTGLVEMPLGSVLKDIIFEIGQGSPAGKRIKAVQTGGPSGGCIPARHFDSLVDYESLREIGAIMGSGGMVVMDEDTCMVDVARYFIEFSHSESCGKCVPCRVGLDAALGMLRRITDGEGEDEDMATLEELGLMIRECSLCGLGQTAPNPVLTTLRYFRREYEEHIRKHTCGAGVCEKLFLAPCENSCPLRMQIPAFMKLFAEDRIEDAAELVWLDNPLPGSTGRICQHPCEERCRRAAVDTPLNMREIHRRISDTIFENLTPQAVIERLDRSKLPPTGKKVAVAGAGPSGLTAAFYLALLGHEVTVFESRSAAGGMLRYSLPEYRLPKSILDKELEVIRGLGVRFTFDRRVGVDLLVEDLEQDHDAVFLAVGTWKPSTLDIPDEDAPGVWHALHFLEQVAVHGAPELGARTVVIGGGNAAIDSARTALRLGSKVTIVYRRERRDMPAISEEVEDALAEGAELVFLHSPKRVLRGTDGRVRGIECVVTEPGPFDSSGRRKPLPTAERRTFDCNTLIIAIGEKPDSEVFRQAGIRVCEDDTVDVDWISYATARARVHAGGDLVTGASNVSSTMATGKAAARAIDFQLMGRDRFSRLRRTFEYGMDAPLDPPAGERRASRKLPAESRSHDFSEVLCGLDSDGAKAESERCLRCDVRTLPPPDPHHSPHQLQPALAGERD